MNQKKLQMYELCAEGMRKIEPGLTVSETTGLLLLQNQTDRPLDYTLVVTADGETSNPVYFTLEPLDQYAIGSEEFPDEVEDDEVLVVITCENETFEYHVPYSPMDMED